MNWWNESIESNQYATFNEDGSCVLEGLKPKSAADIENKEKDRIHTQAIRPERAEAPSPGQRPGYKDHTPLAPCFTLIEQALSVFFNVNYV